MNRSTQLTLLLVLVTSTPIIVGMAVFDAPPQWVLLVYICGWTAGFAGAAIGVRWND